MAKEIDVERLVANSSFISSRVREIVEIIKELNSEEDINADKELEHLRVVGGALDSIVDNSKVLSEDVGRRIIHLEANIMLGREE